MLARDEAHLKRSGLAHDGDLCLFSPPAALSILWLRERKADLVLDGTPGLRSHRPSERFTEFLELIIQPASRQGGFFPFRVRAEFLDDEAKEKPAHFAGPDFRCPSCHDTVSIFSLAILHSISPRAAQESFVVDAGHVVCRVQQFIADVGADAVGLAGHDGAVEHSQTVECLVFIHGWPHDTDTHRIHVLPYCVKQKTPTQAVLNRPD
jgi:hypothetical protein